MPEGISPCLCTCPCASVHAQKVIFDKYHFRPVAPPPAPWSLHYVCACAAGVFEQVWREGEHKAVSLMRDLQRIWDPRTYPESSGLPSCGVHGLDFDLLLSMLASNLTNCYWIRQDVSFDVSISRGEFSTCPLVFVCCCSSVYAHACAVL